MNNKNNFDFLRFLFAVFVVISHSYPLSGENLSSQWIYQVSNGQIVLAKLGLDGFFIISGYFIYQSLQRSKTLFSYYKKRFLRLFPALFIVLVISILLLPFVYDGAIPILENPQVYTYIPYNMSLYNFQPVIEGVFDGNPYHAINGSLWTIRYEFSLYIAISLLYFIRKNEIAKKGLIFVCYLTFIVLYNFFINRFAGSSVFGMIGYEILELGTFFVCGSLLAAINFEKLIKYWMLPLALLIVLLSINYGFYSSVKHVVLPIIVLTLGFMPLPFFSNFGKIGDMSYGIYIYSFPIQQTLMYFFYLKTNQLIVYSLLVSLVFGYLSWHLIEKKALKYK